MRILKKILLTFFALVFLICIVGYFYYKHKITPAPNELSTKQIFINTPFKWEAIPTNKGLDSNGAMFVPVYLRGCPKRFYMQFDLGHPTSCFYKCTLDKINSKYHNISFQQNSEQVHLSNFDFYIDKFLINAKMISALNCTVSDFNWDDSTSIITIGTLGSDIIENKILVIDYPQTNIYIGNEIPQDIASLVFFSDFKFKYRRILLPSVIGKKNEDVFFDTGTSAFELMTDSDTWNKLANKDALINTFDINNWGKKWIVHSIATNDSISFNSTKIPLKNVTYVDGPGVLLKLIYKISGVGGLIGNKLFLNKKIIIDTKKLKFGIMN